MIYEFGDYKIKTQYLRGNLFHMPRWWVAVYYKNNIVAKSDYHFKETYALKWAKHEIWAHKAALKNLSYV